MRTRGEGVKNPKTLPMSLVDAPLAARGVAQLLVTFGALFKSLCVALIAAGSVRHFAAAARYRRDFADLLAAAFLGVFLPLK